MLCEAGDEDQRLVQGAQIAALSDHCKRNSTVNGSHWDSAVISNGGQNATR